MRRFEGRTFLVVGASSGIGRATAERLASEGGRVVGVARTSETLQAAIAALPGEGHQAIAADAVDYAALAPVIAAGKAAGGFSGAALCAGVNALRPLALLDEAGLRTILDVNVVSTLNATRAFTKAAAKSGGSVVWLSSVATERGSAGFIAYAAAKGALNGALKSVAAEVAGRNIRVNAVAAGVVQTPMADGWMAKLSEDQRRAVESGHLFGLGRPEDVAGAIAFLLSDDSRWMTGATMTVDGGLSVR